MEEEKPTKPVAESMIEALRKTANRLLLQYKLPVGSILKVIHPDVMRSIIR